MILSILVAASENNCIGINNKLPWHLKSDLQYFKKLTMHHCVIMGRNTYESIGKPLPNRVNIVLSQNADFKAEGVVIRNSIEEAIAYCERWKQEEVFIIGGAKIYEQTFSKANKIYLTRVETTIKNGDAFIPAIDRNQWTLQKAVRHTADEQNDFDHIFETYIPKQGEPIIYR
jgi:dihydrofolate reductase